MNEVLRQIKARKSVRIFENKRLPEEIKKEIIQAAFEAPTAGCMMLYTILDITDKELKKKLGAACDNQLFITDAPMVLIFLADYQRWYDTFTYENCIPRKPGKGDIVLAAADAVIAAQNTVTAAESLGLGSCYIGDILENCEEVREMLNLPEYVFPAAMLIYGYPTEKQKQRKKPVRFDKEYIVFQNKYKKLSRQEHLEMHNKRNIKSGKTDPESIQALCSRKYMSDFSIEMNRSASQYLKNFKD